MRRFSSRVRTLRVLRGGRRGSLFVGRLRDRVRAFVRALPARMGGMFVLDEDCNLGVGRVSIRLSLSPGAMRGCLAHTLLRLHARLGGGSLVDLLFLLCLYSGWCSWGGMYFKKKFFGFRLCCW